MNGGRLLVFAALGVIAGRVIWWSERVSDAEARQSLENYVIQPFNEVADTIMGAFLRLSNMRNVTIADVRHPNVQALLRVIRTGETGQTDLAYRTLYGGGLFSGFADHPRIAVTAAGRTSTAAGAYQFLASTWDETAKIMRLPDFSPASQDLAAVGRIAARGALDDAKAGRLDTALRKISCEWASMPGSPYGQPVITLAKSEQVFTIYGGVLT